MLAHHQNLSLASSHGQLHPLLISRCRESLLMQKLLCTAAQVLQQTQQRLLWSRGTGCHQCMTAIIFPLCALPQSSCEGSGCFLLALSLAFAAQLLSKGSIHYTMCRDISYFLQTKDSIHNMLNIRFSFFAMNGGIHCLREPRQLDLAMLKNNNVESHCINKLYFLLAKE